MPGNSAREKKRPESRLRRNLLAAGGALVLGSGAVMSARLGLWRGRAFQFEALEEPAGFRRISAGDISRGADPLVGLKTSGAGSSVRDKEVLASGICLSLFGTNEPPPGVVSIASFSDYRCPYCRVLTEKLAEIEIASAGEVSVKWHEWPLLGDVSEISANAALAARRQGAYLPVHARLMRTPFVPTEGYLRSMAIDLGIDPERLLADMNGSAVAQEIETSRRLAALFGFPGTPALVVGRTVVVGVIGSGRLARLIERERNDGPVPACYSG
jgi:predicted DsbA family dithiol-disulfide isomerase